MFEFVVVSHPDEVRERNQQRKIRQHAIRRGIETSRATKATLEKDVMVTTRNIQAKAAMWTELANATTFTQTPSVSLLDPFDTLCGNSERLRSLLRHRMCSTCSRDLCLNFDLLKALVKFAGEPLFRVESTGNVRFQGLNTLTQGALADTTFFHAFSLILALAANSNRPNQETFTSRGQVLKSLSTTVEDSEWKPAAPTIMAILILIGYEYRVQDAASSIAAIHIHGLLAMMRRLETENHPNAGQMQRALFWQDLMSSLATGAPRIFHPENHRGFTSLRDMGRLELCVLPPGFQSVSKFWPREFTIVLEDLHALCRFVDIKCKVGREPSQEPFNLPLMAELDDEGYPVYNSQADLESRLVDLLSESRRVPVLTDPIYQACIFAAYLCTYKLSTGIWEGHFAAEKCVSGILNCLFNSAGDLRWRLLPKLLLWLLFTSGGLTEDEASRDQATLLLQRFRYSQPLKPNRNWSSLKTELENFVWCEFAMERKFRDLWNHYQRTRYKESGVTAMQTENTWPNS